MKTINDKNTIINTNYMKSPLTNKDIFCISKEEKSLELKEISNKNLQSKSKISTLNSVETLQKLVNYTNKLIFVREDKNIGLNRDSNSLNFTILEEENKKEKEIRIMKNFINKNRRKINLKLSPQLYDYNIEVSKLLKSFYIFDKFIGNSQNIVYKFKNLTSNSIMNLDTILNDAFYSMRALISKPVLLIKGKKIIINLFFFYQSKKSQLLKINKNSLIDLPNDIEGLKGRKLNFKYSDNYSNFLNTNKIKLELLAKFLSKRFKKNVEFELIKVHYPVNESFILAKSIGLLGNKLRRRFKYFVNYAFSSAKINNPNIIKISRISNTIKHNASTAITGIFIKLGGRLAHQKIIPRKSSQVIQEGSLTRSNTNIVTTSRFTHKNRRGAYSVTVSMGHKFF